MVGLRQLTRLRSGSEPGEYALAAALLDRAPAADDGAQR
jgi:hypothetical protein